MCYNVHVCRKVHSRKEGTPCTHGVSSVVVSWRRSAGRCLSRLEQPITLQAAIPTTDPRLRGANPQYCGGWATTDGGTKEKNAVEAGNDYIVSKGYTLRTPTNGSYTFLGDSLTLGAGVCVALRMPKSSTLTINNCIVTGKPLFNCWINYASYTIAGNFLVQKDGVLEFRSQGNNGNVRSRNSPTTTRSIRRRTARAATSRGRRSSRRGGGRRNPTASIRRHRASGAGCCLDGRRATSTSRAVPASVARARWTWGASRSRPPVSPFY